MPTATKRVKVTGKPAKAKAKPSKVNAKPKVERQVVHSKVSTKLCTGDSAITAATAKKLLGWEEETEKTPFGNKFLLKHQGKKIRCTNNITNRPLHNSNLAKLKQEILRNRWAFNGEPIIIGTTGLILNGQHTLIALIMACDDYDAHPENWPALTSPPTVDKLVVYGVSEDDAVVNTMDTCKPRSLMDVIYRANYFSKLPGSAQRTVARMTEHCIKMLWHRTGIMPNAFAVKRTHSESIAFLENHLTILECVSHIYQENDATNKIGKYVSSGYAAAAMYLMACSNSDPEAYYKADQPCEQVLDLGLLDKAGQFFVELAGGSDSLKAVRTAIQDLAQGGSNSIYERWAVLAKAWPVYSEGSKVTDQDLVLEFEHTETGERYLVEMPLFGGIDIGEDGLFLQDVPSPAEIEEATKKVRNQEPKASRKGDQWAKGDVAWIDSMEGEPELATLTNDPFECADGVTRVNVESKDGNWVLRLDDIRLTKFNTR